MPGASIVNWASVPGQGGAGVERRSVPGDGASVTRVQIAAGTSAGRHSHDHEQFVLVVAGGGRLECEAGTIELRPDTVIRFEPGAWHSALFETDTVLLEINMNSVA